MIEKKGLATRLMALDLGEQLTPVLDVASPGLAEGAELQQGGAGAFGSGCGAEKNIIANLNAPLSAWTETD